MNIYKYERYLIGGFIGLVIGSIFGIILTVLFLPSNNESIITTTQTISVIQEIEDCRNKGGDFWIHKNYGATIFPSYRMYCDITSTERTFEYDEDDL